MMNSNELPRISTTLGRPSFRNSLGYAIFFLAVVLPTTDAWLTGTDKAQVANESSWGPSRGFNQFQAWPDGRTTVRERMNQSWWPNTSKLMWLFGKTVLAVIGATVSLMILMPFRGCKRYAILFGPPMGLMVVTAVGLWLAGRTEIYRFEPVFVGILAAAPTFALWFFCCKFAYEKRPRMPFVVEAEIVESQRPA